MYPPIFRAYQAKTSSLYFNDKNKRLEDYSERELSKRHILLE